MSARDREAEHARSSELHGAPDQREYRRVEPFEAQAGGKFDRESRQTGEGERGGERDGRIVHCEVLSDRTWA